MFRQVSRLALLCACGFGGLTGCNSARYVTIESTGGVVAIPSNTNFWPTFNRRHAEELMQARCPAGYVIEREEEVVVGTTQSVDTTTNTKGDATLAALRIAPVTQETQQKTTSQNMTEWRIYYRRKDAAVVSSAAPVQPAAAVNPAAGVNPAGPPRGNPVPVSPGNP
jgi:hypothetical protein